MVEICKNYNKFKLFLYEIVLKEPEYAKILKNISAINLKENFEKIVKGSYLNKSIENWKK